MVDITDFKEEKKPFLTVTEVMNAKTRVATIRDEATIQEFASKKGNTFKKLVIPVVFDGKECILSVYPAVSDRIKMNLGSETKQWIGAKLAIVIAGSATPYLTVDVLESPKGGLQQ